MSHLISTDILDNVKAFSPGAQGNLKSITKKTNNDYLRFVIPGRKKATERSRWRKKRLETGRGLFKGIMNNPSQ
jgi:hypothetical protein